MSDDEHATRTEDRDSSSDRGDSEASSDSPVDEQDVEAAKEETRKVEQRYEPGARPTVVVDGTGGTVAGTAFASDEDIEKHQAERSEPEES